MILIRVWREIIKWFFAKSKEGSIFCSFEPAVGIVLRPALHFAGSRLFHPFFLRWSAFSSQTASYWWTAAWFLSLNLFHFEFCTVPQLNQWKGVNLLINPPMFANQGAQQVALSKYWKCHLTLKCSEFLLNQPAIVWVIIIEPFYLFLDRLKLPFYAQRRHLAGL